MAPILSVLSTLLLVSASVAAQYTTGASPIATVRNGTYEGRYEPTYGTEYFLGMPYAQPPVEDLRFRVPASLNTSWTGTRNATEFGYQCIGYGRDTWSQGNYVSEDCLTLNVVKSRGSGTGLPVVVSQSLMLASLILIMGNRSGFMAVATIWAAHLTDVSGPSVYEQDHDADGKSKDTTSHSSFSNQRKQVCQSLRSPSTIA